jgi:hypothetical protein
MYDYFQIAQSEALLRQRRIDRQRQPIYFARLFRPRKPGFLNFLKPKRSANSLRALRLRTR